MNPKRIAGTGLPCFLVFVLVARGEAGHIVPLKWFGLLVSQACVVQRLLFALWTVAVRELSV
jgi:hypothetical protein